MPFDKILVKMHIDIVYENGFDLFFEFFSMDEHKNLKKLAYGKQSIVWIKREGLKAISSKLPNKIVEKVLLKYKK